MIRGLVAVLVASPTAAFAQPAREGFALDRFHAPPSVEDGFARERPSTLGHLRPSASLVADYAYAPLVLAQGDASVGNVVGHEAALHLALALGILDRFQAEVGLPLTVFQSGDDPALPVSVGGVPVRAQTYDAPGRFAVGDPTVGASVLAFGEETGPQVGASLAFPIPVGSQEDLASDGGFGMRLRADGALVSSGGSIGLGLGFARRPRRAFEAGVLETGNELTFDAGAYVSVADGVEAGLEVVGATLVRDAFASDQTALEALLGARVALPMGLVVGVGGGPGLTRAAGTPTVRALLTVGFALPRPPKPEERTGPRPEEEDIIGAAPTDRDADGIPDDRDLCPVDAEPTNGMDDEDGCPDTVRYEDGRIRLMGGISFAFGSEEIAAESIQTVEELAALLGAHPEIASVRIQGYGDERDGSRADMALATRRARALAARLVELSIDEGRLQTRGVAGDPEHGSGHIEVVVVEGP
jgi:outer membrane protein OmpA-like peptidoglycan-associated protein